MESKKLSTKGKLRGVMVVLIITLMSTLTTFGCVKKPATVMVNGVETTASRAPEVIELKKYTFNGHDYVGYYSISSDGRSNFLVHDPDCKLCNQKKEQ